VPIGEAIGDPGTSVFLEISECFGGGWLFGVALMSEVFSSFDDEFRFSRVLFVPEHFPPGLSF
jgi:hypothetical protein